jgi:hypothetical protein
MSDEDPAAFGIECVVTGVLDDGVLVLSVPGQELRSVIHGLDVPLPVPAEYVEVITQRVPRTGEALRARLIPAPSPAPVRAQLHYLAWRDKSGPVWRDLALVLLAEGAARVAPHEFPERDAYLDAERMARQRQVGVWSR